ncbi:MAG: 50S ribosomal protein L18 [Litorimonas sp.]
MASSAHKSMKRRAQRVRRRLKKHSQGRPRLSVHRSDKNISVQLIDDARGVTVASASTLEDRTQKGGDVAAAARIGKLVAERAVEAGVTDVVFDRGPYLYHGRVKALADAAREAGLKF